MLVLLIRIDVDGFSGLLFVEFFQLFYVGGNGMKEHV